MRLFGTNGIREVVGERLTPVFAEAVAGAIARTAPVGPAIAVGYDGRTSSPALARILGGTLALHGHRVVGLGLLPTPAIQFNVRALGAQLGVIVTASHNPPEFNGFKCIAADGMEVPRSVEEAIEAAVESGEPGSAPFDRIGELREDTQGADRYLDAITAATDVPAIRGRRFRVVLDCGNGASAVTSPTLLRRLGCSVVTLNGQIDGTFPGHLSEPTEANVGDLVRTVPAVGADLGIAHDGDADRAVFVDAAGRYVPTERVLALLAGSAVSRHHGGVVVTPVTASQCVEEVVRSRGGEVVYTRVGSPVVSREMARRKAVFGGEEGGGVIFPELQLARDGAMTAARLLELLAHEGVGLAEAAARVPAYRLLRARVDCPAELRDPVLDRLTRESASAGEHALTLDGLKLVRSDGWVLIRPSGTEPLFRIFAESKEEAKAQALLDEGVSRVRAALSATSAA